ncbi:caspase family protein [Halogranum gelatinilyticum]|uniref:caspase family protein n=1 Tax=Halogranum gelatinilyticum TaxID=660521 RepID=UPI0011146875|nr:caspase family protein [Halogranum gelatinilyticum]
MTVRFEQVSATRLRVVDDIEHTSFEVGTFEETRPETTAGERFRLPVDAAVGVETSGLQLPKLMGVVVRNGDGETVAQSSNREPVVLPRGRYTLEVNTAPMKLYIAVDAPLRVTYGTGSTDIRFDRSAAVALGARSFHEQPAGTVTTTMEPETLMRAVATLGSSLQTISPERSFPTLRGHPPLLRVGDEFDVPDGIERPDTELTLVLPRDPAAVFAATPVAYYLGADVVPGETPRLDGPGWSHQLTADTDLETGLARTLRQTFFLDCLTRTEGYYPVDLHEREAVEATLPLDFGDLYGRPMADQVGAYLDVPFADVEPLLPEWNLTTDVWPTADNVEMLPFLAKDLSLVRCPSERSSDSLRAEPKAVSDFFRAAVPEDGLARGGTSSDDSSEASRGTERPPVDIVTPEPTETVEHAWVGDGYPLGASKSTPESYRRRLDREATDRTSIEITVVCNDPQMRDEDVVADLYGCRELLDFEVEVHYDLTRDQLVQVLETPTNFLHYIGHVDERGLQCADGYLDVTTLECDVAVDSFLLNACQSHEQGEALLDRGSYAGVVTLSDVANASATAFGQTIARLLNCGFTFRSALSVAQEAHVVGYRYTVLGDGGMSLCQAESGVLVVPTVEPCSEDGYLSVQFDFFPSRQHEVGSLVIPYLPNQSKYYLATGKSERKCLRLSDFREFLELETTPVWTSSGLRWSSELELSELD